MEHSETDRRMGHEAIGVVEAVGADVRCKKVGDLVVMPFAYSDGTCVFCHEALHTSCIHGGYRRVGSDYPFLFAAIQLPHEPIIEELRGFGFLRFRNRFGEKIQNTSHSGL